MASPATVARASHALVLAYAVRRRSLPLVVVALLTGRASVGADSVRGQQLKRAAVVVAAVWVAAAALAALVVGLCVALLLAVVVLPLGH